MEVLVGDLDGGGFPKVDAGARGPHDRDVVEEVADCDGIFGGVERGDDTAEGFKRGEGVQGCVVGDEGADLEQGSRVVD